MKTIWIKIIALLAWFLLTITAIQLCTWWNPQANWVLGLSLLANLVQVASTYALYHIFMKVHLTHKHVTAHLGGKSQNGNK